MKNKSKQEGFAAVFFLIIAALGIMYVVKDKDGVNYLESTYKKVKYYTVDRGTEALQKAKEAKDMMQQHEDDLNKALEDN